MAIVELDHAAGLDEERRARSRSVVDDARHLTLGVRLDRQHEAAVADRVEAIGEVRCDVGVPEAAFDLLLELARELARFAPRAG